MTAAVKVATQRKKIRMVCLGARLHEPGTSASGYRPRGSASWLMAMRTKARGIDVAST
jgi:hypothetical protein